MFLFVNSLIYSFAVCVFFLYIFFCCSLFVCCFGWCGIRHGTHNVYDSSMAFEPAIWGPIHVGSNPEISLNSARALFGTLFEPLLFVNGWSIVLNLYLFAIQILAEKTIFRVKWIRSTCLFVLYPQWCYRVHAKERNILNSTMNSIGKFLRNLNGALLTVSKCFS